MTEEQYKTYKEYFGKTGRRGEKVRFEKIALYKLFEEVFDLDYFTRYFRIEIPEEKGYRL